MESTDSSVGHHQQQQPPQDQVAAPPPPPPQPHLPPGFRFHPTDEELVVHYLKRKTQSAPLPVSIIAEVDLYKFDPWELPAKAVFGEQEWYFFSPRDRKYPNGARPNRAATSGYWKATGTDKPVLSSGGNQKVGVKKALVFYGGKPPRGVKTNWIMHEYRLADSRPSNKSPGYDNNNKKGSLRLDDWVLCRIYKKSNAHRAIDQERDDAIDDMMMMSSMNIASMSSMGLPLSLPTSSLQSHQLSNKPMSTTLNYTSFLDQQGMYDGMMDPNSLSNLAASASASTSGFPLKRALPNLFYQDPLSSGKKSHHHDHDETPDRIDVESTSMGMGPIASLLNQFPTQNQTHTQNQNPSLQHQQQMLGGLQQYPLSGLNWYS